MNGNEGISVADALALRNSGDDGFGGNGAWWIIILILFAAFGGWGNGNGFGGGNNGWNACCTPATMAGMTDAFNFNQLDNGVRGLERGLCDGFYSMNNAIAAVGTAVQTCCCNLQQSMCQGFNEVNMGIMQNSYQNQAGFNALGTQLATNTRDIIVANDKNTDRIINFLTQTEMDKLRTELQSAQFQLSQLSQTSNIVNQLMPVAKPAYLTCSPYAAAFGLYGNNGCGNGCGCC